MYNPLENPEGQGIWTDFRLLKIASEIQKAQAILTVAAYNKPVATSAAVMKILQSTEVQMNATVEELDGAVRELQIYLNDIDENKRKIGL